MYVLWGGGGEEVDFCLVVPGYLELMLGVPDLCRILKEKDFQATQKNLRETVTR